MDDRPAARIPHRTLGRTCRDVSLLGFGAEALGRNGRSFDDAARTLNAVIDMGVTLIDTASAYGNSEAFIGRALGGAGGRHRCGEFTLVTKCGWVNPDYSAAWSPAEIAATIDESVRRLQVDAIDVLLLHSCDLETLKRGEVIAAVQRARDQGKARFIGYSGDNEALAFAIGTDAFDVIECSYNMLDQANATAIAKAGSAGNGGLGVMLKRPVANAVPGATSKPRSEYAAQYWPRWQAIGITQNDLGGIPVLEAALRFSAFHSTGGGPASGGRGRGVSSVLIGSSHASHMAENARVLECGPLPESIVMAIKTAYRRVGASWPALG